MLDDDDARRTLDVLTTAVCFVGHSHVPGVFVEDDRGVSYGQIDAIPIEQGRRYIINCGSVGQPRDWNPDAAYCVYDTVEKEVLIKRVAYDRLTARKKIIDAGLPRTLGDRLMQGA
jgi:diadenosine tetraphosphatase ApaH/serine/threonine PP2A family protein phosphatase